MSMASVRVVEVIPGKPYIGIEVPNSSREMVRLIELLKHYAFEDPRLALDGDGERHFWQSCDY